MLFRSALLNAAHHTEQSRNCHQCDNLAAERVVCEPVFTPKN
jgi:hypothetical protein